MTRERHKVDQILRNNPHLRARTVILDVDLTGDPAYKHIYFQPATISDECVIVDLEGEITEETAIFAKPVLIE